MVLGALVFVGAIVLAPLLAASGWTWAAGTIYRGFHVACHQLPDRSFHLEGYPLAVCARCTGLYGGAVLGLVLYPLARSLTSIQTPRREWLLLAAIPTAIDFGLGVSGILPNTHLSRSLTALVLGVAGAFYIVPGLVSVGVTPFRQLFPSRSYAKG